MPSSPPPTKILCGVFRLKKRGGGGLLPLHRPPPVDTAWKWSGPSVHPRLEQQQQQQHPPSLLFCVLSSLSGRMTGSSCVRTYRRCKSCKPRPSSSFLPLMHHLRVVVFPYSHFLYIVCAAFHGSKSSSPSLPCCPGGIGF